MTPKLKSSKNIPFDVSQTSSNDKTRLLPSNSSTGTLTETESEYPINLELFERTTTPRHRSHRHKRSKLFRCQLRVFCALHRPVGWASRCYHYTFFALIFMSCIVFNIFDAHFGDLPLVLMSLLDLCLTGMSRVSE